MKYIFLICLLYISAIGGIVSKPTTTPYGNYTSFKEYITATGSNNVSIEIGKDIVISGKVVVPSNIDIKAFNNGAKIKGNTGSAADTLVIMHMSAQPTSQIFDTSVTVLFAAGCVMYDNPIWFGADPTGITSSSSAFTRAIDAFSNNGGRINILPGAYKITSTIEITDKRELLFESSMGTENMNQDKQHDTRLFWSGGVKNKPIFYIRRGHGVTFRDLVLDGIEDSTHADTCIAGIWIDENGQDQAAYRCKFKRTKYGIRVASSYNYTTNIWTGGASAYDGYYSAAAAAAGGFATDNLMLESCNFGSCKIAGLSLESAQALDIVVNKCTFFYNRLGIFATGMQGVQLISCSFLNNDSTDIRLTPVTNCTGLRAENCHTERGTGLFFSVLSNSAIQGVNTSFEGCTGGDYRLAVRSGSFSFSNSNMRKISIEDDSLGLIISNCSMDTLKKTSVGNGIFLAMRNSTVKNLVGTGTWDWDASSFESNSIKNWHESSKVSLRLSSQGYLPSLIIGRFDTTKIGSMRGLALHSTSQNTAVISTGGHLTYDGYWKSTTTRGSIFQIYSDGYDFENFYRSKIDSTITNRTSLFRAYGAYDTSYAGEYVFRFPIHNGANAYNNGNWWRGGMLYDTSTNHILISRTGSNVFNKIDIQGDTTSHAKISVTGTTSSSSPTTGALTVVGGIGAREVTTDSLQIGSSSRITSITLINDSLKITVGGVTKKFVATP